ncbi:MAG: aldo/keto reductase, partial [Cytophagia bacterium]|nr:aldo/keto reductase [Cytophagia bacterium]
LGSVQLGIPYGINNLTGKPDNSESFGILKEAYRNGITLLDSAEAYGDSLQVIASYLKENTNQTFDIISKFIGNGESVEQNVRKSIHILGVKNLYAYMYHRFSDYRSEKYRKELTKLKKEGIIQKLGVSLYSIEELETILKDQEITLIQIPFNPFDCSLEKKRLLTIAKKAGKEIHVRSVFLQGLFFKSPESLTGNMTSLKPALQQFNQIIQDLKLTPTEACLNFALHHNTIDYVLVGVERVDQLRQNLSAVKDVFSQDIIKTLESVKIVDTSLLNPSNWKP